MCCKLSLAPVNELPSPNKDEDRGQDTNAKQDILNHPAPSFISSLSARKSRCQKCSFLKALMSYRTFPLWQGKSRDSSTQLPMARAHPFGLVPKWPWGLNNFLPSGWWVLHALPDRNFIALLGIFLSALPSHRSSELLRASPSLQRGRLWQKDRFVCAPRNWSLTLPKFQQSRLRALGSVNMAVQGCTACLERLGCTTASQTPDWGIQAVTKGGKNPEQEREE